MGRRQACCHLYADRRQPAVRYASRNGTDSLHGRLHRCRQADRDRLHLRRMGCQNRRRTRRRHYQGRGRQCQILQNAQQRRDAAGHVYRERVHAAICGKRSRRRDGKQYACAAHGKPDSLYRTQGRRLHAVRQGTHRPGLHLCGLENQRDRRRHTGGQYHSVRLFRQRRQDRHRYRAVDVERV